MRDATDTARRPTRRPAGGHRARRGGGPALSAAAALLALLAVVALLLPSPAAVGQGSRDGRSDWPGYRGAGHDGKSPERGLAKEWPEDGPRVLWRHDLGHGYSGMAVVDDRLYTLYGDGTSEYAVALDAATGERLWRHRLDGFRPDSQGGGPRATPSVAGGHVYVLGARGELAALDAATGEVAWSHDLPAEYGAKIPTWGISTSPLVEGDLLLVDAGGSDGRSILAFRREDGSLAWSSGTDKPGYSTPLPVTVDGRRMVLFFTGTALVGIDPANGRELFRETWRTSYDVNAAMPVFVPPDRVFVSSSYDKGAALYEIAVGDGAVELDEVWSSRVMKNHFNSSVLLGRYLFGFDDGTLKAIEAATGEELWGKRGFGKGSLLYADGHLLVLGERGQLALVEATPRGYVEKASTRLWTAKSWTMPTLAAGRLFVRNEKELVALDLSPRG